MTEPPTFGPRGSVPAVSSGERATSMKRVEQADLPVAALENEFNYPKHPIAGAGFTIVRTRSAKGDIHDESKSCRVRSFS